MVICSAWFWSWNRRYFSVSVKYKRKLNLLKNQDHQKGQPEKSRTAFEFVSLVLKITKFPTFLSGTRPTRYVPYNGYVFWTEPSWSRLQKNLWGWPNKNSICLQNVQCRSFVHAPFTFRNIPNRKRVDRILKWISGSENVLPDLLLLYFDDVDHAGHLGGPDSLQVRIRAHRDILLASTFWPLWNNPMNALFIIWTTRSEMHLVLRYV